VAAIPGDDVRPSAVERELDGAVTAYFDVPVAGDRVERLLTRLFAEHWAEITVGPLVEGAAYEIAFSAPPKVTMLDGYLTVDPGGWHFHLCVNDHRGTPSAELARLRRVGRAAFFRTEGGSCAPTTWGLRLWNGRGEQMITVLFPSPHFDADWRRLAAPRWEKTALWRALREEFTSEN
jgi:hypothetical protein